MEKINRRIDLIEDKDERKQQTVDEIRNANVLLKNEFKELKQEKETHLIDFAEHLNSLENKLNKLKEKVAQDSQNNQTLHSSIKDIVSNFMSSFFEQEKKKEELFKGELDSLIAEYSGMDKEVKSLKKTVKRFREEIYCESVLDELNLFKNETRKSLSSIKNNFNVRLGSLDNNMRRISEIVIKT